MEFSRKGLKNKSKISSIEKNSPAALGGVEKGDFIVAINGIRTCGLRNKTIVALGYGLENILL